MMDRHDPTTPYDDQTGCDARFEWGATGVRRLAPVCDVVVIVDVLSFGTCVDVAAARGAAVFPYRWRDATAEAFAREQDALLAVSRGQATSERPYSLSPASLAALPQGARLVLPSPNGSILAALAAESGAAVLAGCLRNAGAVAAAARSLGSTVAVIAAGERWERDDTLRPAIEDMVGAGAILAALRPTAPSPEAIAAIAVYAAAAAALHPFIAACASGRELALLGYPEDVEIAAQHDVSDAAPLLQGGAFRSSPSVPLHGS